MLSDTRSDEVKLRDREVLRAENEALLKSTCCNRCGVEGVEYWYNLSGRPSALERMIEEQMPPSIVRPWWYGGFSGVMEGASPVVGICATCFPTLEQNGGSARALNSANKKAWMRWRFCRDERQKRVLGTRLEESKDREAKLWELVRMKAQCPIAVPDWYVPPKSAKRTPATEVEEVTDAELLRRIQAGKAERLHGLRAANAKAKKKLSAKEKK